MCEIKFLIFTVLLAVVHCRYIVLEEISDDITNIHPVEYLPEQGIEEVHPAERIRVCRQSAGVINTNPDGSFNIQGKSRIAGNDANSFNALAGINGLKNGGKFGSASAGLGFENHNGHGVSLTGTNIPGFGNQLTAAGKLGLINTDAHKLSANAFVTKNMPNIPNMPNVPNFNTHGGSLNYMFKDKIGGSLGVSNTDFLKRTDYSAMGNLNLLRSPSSSLDFNAGATRSVSPFMTNTRWQPTAGLSFSRFF